MICCVATSRTNKRLIRPFDFRQVLQAVLVAFESVIELNGIHTFEYFSLYHATKVAINIGLGALSAYTYQRFWIRDLKTGKYWKKDNHDFDLNFGLYSACNRRISHGRTYIIVIYKGVITVYDWHDSMVFVSIDKILKELKYSPLDRLKTLENVLNAKISTHIFEQPLIQKKNKSALKY